VYAQILSIWTFFWFISSPLSTLYSVLEKQESGLILNSIIFATRFLSLGIGGVLGNPRLALLLFSASGTLVYGYLSLAITAASGVPWRRSLGVLAFHFLLFVPAGAVLIAMKAAGAGSLAIVLVSSVLLVLYGLYILKSEPQIRILLGQIWARKGLN
jgi:hypothetical protein